MIFAKINAESDDSVVAQKYGVKGYPTFVLTDNNGVEVDRIIGFREADVFLQTINDYLNGIGTLDAMLAEADTAENRVLYFEIGDKYKYRSLPTEAEEWYNKALELGKPDDSLSGEVRFAIADMYRRNHEYDKAIESYEAIELDFKGSKIAEYAAIYIPVTFKYKEDTAAAIVGYENYLKNYPEGEDIEYAKEQIKLLKGN